MIAIVRKLLGGLRAEFQFIVLLAIAGVGAWLYVQARHAERDRDDALKRAELVCAAVGVDWSEKHMRGPGTACALRARQLRTDREAIDRQTNQILSDAIKAQTARSAVDAQAARAALSRARDAENRMEKANADADANDHVRADWIAALNDLAGLRRTTR
ncbi:hypothetical protein ACWGNZ_14685 [Sphingomonas zeae]